MCISKQVTSNFQQESKYNVEVMTVDGGKQLF